MKTRGQLKSEAKSVLNGRWKDSVLMCLVPTLISIAFAVVIVVIVVLPLMALSQNGAFDSQSINEASNSTGGSGGGLISGLFSALFGAGISWTFLDLLRGNKQEIRPFSDVFRGFSGVFALGIIVIYILSTIFVSLWALLFVIPGIIKSYSTHKHTSSTMIPMSKQVHGQIFLLASRLAAD